MRIFQNPTTTVAQAAGKVRGAEEDLQRRRLAQEVHAAARPDGAEIDRLIAWKREAADLQLQIEACEEAVQHASTALRSAEEAEAQQREEEARRTAEGLADEHAKLAETIGADAERLALKLHQLEEMRSKIEAAGVMDGERRIRQWPAQFEPAIYEDREKWLDADGKEPMVFYHTHSGELAFQDQAKRFRRRMVPVMVREKIDIPAGMPERFATAFKLVDLAGAQIWPKGQPRQLP